MDIPRLRILSPLYTSAVTLVLPLFVAGYHNMLTSSCCSLATGSCRSSCEEISLVSLALNDDDRWRYMNKLSTFCSSQLIPFWTCLNETLQEVDKGERFFGRPCCALPLSQTCTLVCLQAQTKEDLVQACRPSDEITFYACLDHQKAGQQCCEESTNSECLSACKEIFATTTGAPSQQMRKYVSNACSQGNTHVLECTKNYTQTTPAENPSKNLQCCDQSSDSECRMACRNILKTQTIGQEIVENLIAAGCGLPMPHDRLWQCFLANADSIQHEPKSLSPLDSLGMDSAKLQCCFKATSIACQRLCIKTYTYEWEKTWEEFDRQCQYQPTESPMLQCIAEVEEPCELGCQGLSYCTNFNNHPVDLFRNCNSQTDRAARYDVQLWEGGIIQMPMIDIPVLDIRTCFPDMWKTIACALQIKPCHNKAHINMICKSDCIKLLSQCVDESRLQEGQSAESLCEVLSPSGKNPYCIPLGPYLDEVSYDSAASDVTHPCKANLCKTNEVCMVNRSCRVGEVCFTHQCMPGCRMGAVSQLVVPANSHVLVPRIYHGKFCHRACYCNGAGVLENCAAMPCLSKGRCAVQAREIAHMAHYREGCSLCVCYAGELRCTKICESSDFQLAVEYRTGVTCICPDHFVPVCGANGKTYSSACVARCAGLKDWHVSSGSCAENDPCESNPCGSKRKCLPRRQVCLSIRRRCPQYICVNANVSCHRQPLMPVCDSQYREHSNPCYLLQEGRQLGYYGKCLHNCLRTGTVCGYNGQTYASECAARADKTLVDYRQACIVHYLPVKQPFGGNGCSRVQCQPLPSSNCTGIIPLRSCCPVCGAVLHLIYSQKLLDRALDAIRSVQPAVTLTLTEKLQEHVKTAECDVYAHLNAESAVTVIVQPNSNQPSALQVEACIREADKLHALVEQMSPTLLTELPLSALIGAFLLKPASGAINAASFNNSLSSWAFVMTSLLCLTSLHKRRQ